MCWFFCNFLNQNFEVDSKIPRCIDFRWFQVKFKLYSHAATAFANLSRNFMRTTLIACHSILLAARVKIGQNEMQKNAGFWQVCFRLSDLTPKAKIFQFSKLKRKKVNAKLNPGKLKGNQPQPTNLVRFKLERVAKL